MSDVKAFIKKIFPFSSPSTIEKRLLDTIEQLYVENEQLKETIKNTRPSQPQPPKYGF